MKYKLQDLIDMKHFQYLQDKLNEIYSFPSAIIDNEGNILTATAWQDVCTQFHRKNKECEIDCLKSDKYIQDHLHEANPAVSYICPRGLVDNATPIIIDGKHYGNFFTGQFFLEKPEIEYFRAQAKTFGFDETTYIEAVKKVPIWSKKQLDSYLFFIKGLIFIITESGMKHLKEIEARKKVEDSEERANAILLQMNDGFLITNTQGGKIVYGNDAMCRMLGYTRDELFQMTMSDIEENDSQDEIDQRILNVIQAGSASFESRFIRKNSSILDMDISVTYMPERGLFFGFYRDISDRKKTELALRESEVWHRTVLETAMDGFWLVDTQGCLLEVNETYCEMSGYTAQELLTMKISDLETVETAKDTAIHITKILADREDRFESQHRRKDGTNFDVEISVQFQSRDGGQLVAFLRDITERKQAELAQIKSSNELIEAYDATLLGWSNALELREHETAGHSQRVVNITIELARLMGLSEQRLVHVQRGALLHDIGKMGIPDSILLKPGPLSDDEWVIMRQHPLYAYRLLSIIPYLVPALEIPYCHHEKWNGTGYPRKLKGEDIPFEARLFTVVDVFDALTSNRPYRPAWTVDAAINYLKEHSEEYFDPRVVNAFIKLITEANYPQNFGK